jgi:hypothetical protein
VVRASRDGFVYGVVVELLRAENEKSDVGVLVVLTTPSILLSFSSFSFLSSLHTFSTRNDQRTSQIIPHASMVRASGDGFVYGVVVKILRGEIEKSDVGILVVLNATSENVHSISIRDRSVPVKKEGYKNNNF